MARGFANVDSARMGTVNNVAILTTSTSVASSAFGTETHQIRIATTAPAFFKLGDPAATPTAAATDALLPTNWVDYITVTPGQKIAFFSATIQTISVIEVTQ